MGKNRKAEADRVRRALQLVEEQERNSKVPRLQPSRRRPVSPARSVYRTPSLWDGTAYDPVAMGETGLIGPYYERAPDTRGRGNTKARP